MADCIEKSKKEILTGTCLAGMIGTLLLGLWGNFPGIMVPAGSTTPYFAYSVVGYMGSGSVPYRAALTSVFLEGWLFLFLSLTGLRSVITRLIPRGVALGLRSGLGLFMTFMALQGPHGLGLIAGQSSTLVTLGTCSKEYRIFIDGGENYLCDGGTFTDLRLIVALAIMIPVVIAYHNGFNGAVLTGLVTVSIVMWIPFTNISEFPDTDEGHEAWDDFIKIFQFEPVNRLWWVFSFDLTSADVWIAFGTMFYVDLLDTTGTMFTVASGSNMIREDGTFFGERAAFSSDAIATIIAGCFGSPPLTCAIESSMAVALGGRTGLLSVWAAILYLVLMTAVPLMSHLPQ